MRRLVVLLLFALPLAAQSPAPVPMLGKSATPTLIVVRHAEAEKGDDPALTAAGSARAAALAKALRNAGVTAIYVTQYRRTKETAQPLANALNVPMIEYDARGEVVPRITEGIAVIVGHSNTVPAIVKAASGVEAAAIAHDEHDRMYVVRGQSVIAAKY